MEPAAWFTHMRGWEEELLLYVRIDIAVAWVVAHGPHTLFWQDATCVHVFGMNGRVRQGMEWDSHERLSTSVLYSSHWRYYSRQHTAGSSRLVVAKVVLVCLVC